MKKQLLILVALPVFIAGGSLALTLKVYWLGVLLYILSVIAFIFVLISNKKLDKETKKLAEELRKLIYNGEIVNPVFSIENQSFEKDKYILKDYLKKINYKDSVITDFLSGILDNVPFKYREELVVGKNIKNTKLFTVISFVNNKALESCIIENPVSLSTKYEESYIVIDKEYVSYYINDVAIAGRGFDAPESMNRVYNDLLGFIRDMITTNYQFN